MFCYQSGFNDPTRVVSKEQFWALVRASETVRKVREGREALTRGDKATYDRRKKGLPLMIFIGTFDVSERTIENKRTGEKRTLAGRWRNQKHVKLNGLVVADYDHLDSLTPNPSPKGEGSKKTMREIWDEAYAKLSDEDKARILLVYVTPSGEGLKVVFMADVNAGNLIDNQKDFSAKLGLPLDESCKDGCRGAFMTTEEDIILLDERIFSYENAEYGERYNEAYHEGKSQATATNTKQVLANTNLTNLTNEYNGVPYAKIIEAWLDGVNLDKNRHNTLTELASHLRYLIGKNPKKITEVVMSLPWVQDLAAEGEDVAGTVSSVMGWRYNERKPDKLREALEKVGALEQKTSVSASAADDIYAAMPLDKWAEELQEMAEYYPCMKELFLNAHPHKLPAILFSSAALFGTLMTRAYYHFWYEPEIIRRLNYCVFIIGDPGAGKNIVEKFYKKIADPMIQADQCLIDAVNRYKDGRTERTTSTKAQKGEALKRPVVGIRVHPARTATGEFIRHMQAAVENIQGHPMNLHMFSFDAELDNVTKNNKGGDWKDREILELKAFHNEEDGQMYANQESITGMFNVFWNFIYTGTPYALHRKVNQRNFGTGMSTRLAVIPLPDKGMAQRHQKVDPNSNEALRTWAYRLDKVEGELPIEPLNDETFDWQSSHLEIAEFNGDKADRTLLKRIPYYGIGVSLPFILMRHWEEWQESKTLTMDDTDKRLCRLAMDIQYRCQQFFFGEMAYNYFADQNKEFVQRRRTGRYEECFRKLPDEFKTQQFMDVFGCSQQAASRAITRFRNDGVIEVVKYGIYKKVVSELP